MAAQVDFYILPDQATEQRSLFACRLAEKAFKLGHRIYIHTAGSEAARALDEMLWRFQPTSFVPHALADTHTDAETDAPVAIGWGNYGGGHEVLINLDLQVPAFFERFARISEIVVQVPDVLQATRSAWRFYQERGCPLQRHDMRR